MATPAMPDPEPQDGAISLTGRVRPDTTTIEVNEKLDLSSLTWEQHEAYVKSIIAECNRDAASLYYKISTRLYPALLDLEHRYRNERCRNDLKNDGEKKDGWYAYLESIDVKPDTFLKWKQRHATAVKDVEQLCLPPKPKPDPKPKLLTALEHKLLGTATNVHEALTDIAAGRIDEATARLKEKLPTQDRIEEHLQRGVKPTVLNPEGKATADPATNPSDEIESLKEQIADLQHQNVTLAVMVDNQTAAPALRAGAKIGHSAPRERCSAAE